MKFKDITFYLDSAHTSRSMKCCAEWFKKVNSIHNFHLYIVLLNFFLFKESELEEKELKKVCTKILVFNVTKHRDSKSMFQKLMACDITHAIFVPNIATLRKTTCADQTNFAYPVEEQLMQVVENHKIWLTLNQEQMLKNDSNIQRNWEDAIGYDITTNFESLQYDEIISKTTAFSSIANAIVWLAEDRDEKLEMLTTNFYTPEMTKFTPGINPSHHLQVLVTGSVHLIGGFLRILDPSINE